jgi:hypothetical protein
MEAETLQELFSNNPTGIKGIMKLSFLESMYWKFGWRPTAERMGDKVFAFMDTNGSNQLPVVALDVLARNLEGAFHVSKDALDMVEVFPSASLHAYFKNTQCQVIFQGTMTSYHATRDDRGMRAVCSIQVAGL